MREALIAIPFGVAIGLLLGLLGGGGSILTVPVLVYVLGEPVKDATTESLLIVGVTALAGAFAAARARRVCWRVGLAFAGAGAFGSLGGTALNRVVDARALLLGFALLLLAAAFAMLRGRTSSASRPAPVHVAWGRVLVAGTATGVLTGFFGVGGGFVIVPALMLAVGLPLTAAIGTSLLVIALTSAVALGAHLASGGIDVPLSAAFASAAIAGAIAGTHLQGRIPERVLRSAFAALMIAVAALLVVANSSVLG
jgi:uncharacterized protein